MRRIKPVARVGAVDINVRYDIHQRGTANSNCPDECFDVLEGEVLFKTDAGNFYRDNSLHVLSCTNGIDTANWRVAGVAVTGFSPRTDTYEQGFVIQCSGLTSIFNNSGVTINAGDNVFVNVVGDDTNNSNNPTGVPRSKRLLKLSKADGQFLGTCAKGGPSKGTIDIVLHQCGPADIVGGEEEFNEGASRFTKPAASVPKPRTNKKSKSSK